jgi:two-component system, NtrC family, sensor kinase
LRNSVKANKLHLLLIDDEVAFLKSISKLFRRRGIDPALGTTGEKGLTILENEPIDVVVLDVKMPGMGGIETLHRIKEKHPKTEVILLTGHANTQDGVDGIKAGAFDYLNKPIEFDHLLTKINQAFDKILMNEEQERQAAFSAKMEQQMMAKERLAALGTMAVGVAHEINNPLAIIHEAADWMRLLLRRRELVNMPLRSDFEKALEKIDTGVERTKNITHQLLGSVKKADMAAYKSDLSVLVDESVELANKEALKKNISISIKKNDGDKIIWSDPYQIRQVLLNLLTNAVHATKPEGEITVSIEDAGEEVYLKVRDTGQGIPKENLDKIFEPFFSTKSPGKGTGLGLYVTRRIVENLGGSIDCQSRYGQGTEFRVKLPRHLVKRSEQHAEE